MHDPHDDRDLFNHEASPRLAPREQRNVRVRPYTPPSRIISAVKYCCGCGFMTTVHDEAVGHCHGKRHTLQATGTIRPE